MKFWIMAQEKKKNNLFIQMEISMLEIGWIMKDPEKDFYIVQMEINITGNG